MVIPARRSKYSTTKSNSNSRSNNKYSLQNFLTKVCEQRRIGSVYLINGIQLQGIFCSYDNEVIVLGSLKNGQKQIIYQHAIATIILAN